MNIINEIMNWPIIIQGALGSFLFWLLLLCIKKLTKFISKRIERDREEGNALNKIVIDEITKGNSQNTILVLVGIIYTSLGFIVRFLIVTIIGYLILPFIPVFGYIGFFIGIYFLLKAVTYLRLNASDDES